MLCCAVLCCAALGCAVVQGPNCLLPLALRPISPAAPGPAASHLSYQRINTSPAPSPFVQECVGINLANQTGREGKLSAAYAAAAREYAAAGGAGFRLEPFDFHKQCGATNYARLGLLWEVRSREGLGFSWEVRAREGLGFSWEGQRLVVCWLPIRRVYVLPANPTQLDRTTHAPHYLAGHRGRLPPLWLLVPRQCGHRQHAGGD